VVLARVEIMLLKEGEAEEPQSIKNYAAVVVDLCDFGLGFISSVPQFIWH
jgi:hypothetical protein